MIAGNTIVAISRQIATSYYVDSLPKIAKYRFKIASAKFLTFYVEIMNFIYILVTFFVQSNPLRKEPHLNY